MPLETWTAYTALSEEDWVAARAVLRDLQLITERRRFDLERNEIVTEISFVVERFSAEVARVREQLRDDAWAAMRAEQTL